MGNALRGSAAVPPTKHMFDDENPILVPGRGSSRRVVRDVTGCPVTPLPPLIADVVAESCVGTGHEGSCLVPVIL